MLIVDGSMGLYMKDVGVNGNASNGSSVAECLYLRRNPLSAHVAGQASVCEFDQCSFNQANDYLVEITGIPSDATSEPMISSLERLAFEGAYLDCSGLLGSDGFYSLGAPQLAGMHIDVVTSIGVRMARSILGTGAGPVGPNRARAGVWIHGGTLCLVAHQSQLDVIPQASAVTSLIFPDSNPTDWQAGPASPGGREGPDGHEVFLDSRATASPTDTWLPPALTVVHWESQSWWAIGRSALNSYSGPTTTSVVLVNLSHDSGANFGTLSENAQKPPSIEWSASPHQSPLVLLGCMVIYINFDDSMTRTYNFGTTFLAASPILWEFISDSSHPDGVWRWLPVDDLATSGMRFQAEYQIAHGVAMRPFIPELSLLP